MLFSPDLILKAWFKLLVFAEWKREGGGTLVLPCFYLRSGMTVSVETILNVFMAISLYDKILDEVCASRGVSLAESSSSLTKPL